MAADAMSGGLKGAFSGEGHRQLGAGGSRKKSRRRELHPRPNFHKHLPHMWLRHGVWWLAGTWPGARGTPRASRKLAPSVAFRQGRDHDSGARWLILGRRLEAGGIEPASRERGRQTAIVRHLLLCKRLVMTA